MARRSTKNIGAGDLNRGAMPTSSTVATPPPSQSAKPQPAATPSTSGVQALACSAPPTAVVPLDLLGQLFKALRPDLDVSQALAFLAQPIQSNASAVPPASEATPLPAQLMPPTTDDPAREAEATPEEAASAEEKGKEAEAAMAEEVEETGREEERELELQCAGNVVAEMEQLTGPTEEPEKAEPAGTEPEVVVKTPEVVQIADDKVHMATLQEALAITAPTLPVKEVEEGTQ